MLSNDNFLNEGNTFPPFEERERLNKYRDSKYLYDGEHSKVFRRWSYTAGVDDLTLVTNWHKRLSCLWADMVFGQEPEFTADNQEALNEFIRLNDLLEVLYESCIDVSRYGTGVLKVRFDKHAIVEAVPADIWFPVVHPDSLKRIDKHVLAWKWKEVTDKSENWYLSVEIHERGTITYRTYALTSDYAIAGLLEEEVESTGINEFLVRPIHNVTTSDTVFGGSDYDEVNSIIEELEMRLTQIGRVLDKHADPSMYGDEDALEKDELTGDYVVRGGGSFYPVSEDGVPPSYLTWDGKLEEAREEIKLLMEQFYYLTNTSPSAFGEMNQGRVESAAGLKRLLMATVMKANRMKTRYQSALNDIFTIANELERLRGGNAFGKVLIEFRDALPEDYRELTNTEVARYNAGLTSLESAIGRMDGISGEALAKEVAAIQAEKQQRQTNPEGDNNDGTNEPDTIR